MPGLSSKIPSNEKSRHQVDFSLATVNIVLLLVFFFLITGTLVETDELAVDLAQTEDLPIDRLPRPLLLMKDAETWSLDGESVTAATLALAVEDSFERLESPSRTLHLLPDRSLAAGDLVAVLRRPDLADVEIKLVTLRLRGGRQ